MWKPLPEAAGGKSRASRRQAAARSRAHSNARTTACWHRRWRRPSAATYCSPRWATSSSAAAKPPASAPPASRRRPGRRRAWVTPLRGRASTLGAPRTAHPLCSLRERANGEWQDDVAKKETDVDHLQTGLPLVHAHNAWDERIM